jgi:hypothetical protein
MNLNFLASEVENPVGPDLSYQLALWFLTSVSAIFFLFGIQW